MSELKNCIYSGKSFPSSLFSSEHIIPRALGGRNYRKVLVSSEANSRLGAEVDGKLAKDIAFQFARYRNGTKSANGKSDTINIRPVSKVADYDFSKERGHRYTHLSLRGSSGSPLKVHNAKDGTEVNAANANGANLFNANVDHQARFKFSLKCLLAIDFVGNQWKLSKALELTKVQDALFSDEQKSLQYINSLASFTHPFLEDRSTKWVELNQKFERLSRPALPLAHFLARNNGSYFEWSTKVLGTLVSTIRFYRVGENNLPLKENELAAIYLNKSSCRLIKVGDKFEW